MEIFNEIIFTLVFYTMICFTDFVPEIETKVLIGWVACGLVASHFIVNLSIMLYASCKGAKKTCLMKRMRKK